MKQCPECKRAYEDSNSFCVFDGARLEVSEEDPCIGMLVDGKYRIDRKIAKGGTGTVYQATHRLLNAPVAIKIIHPHMATDPRAVERFRREALITMKVRHTNSIAVMDFGITKLKMRQANATSSTGTAILDFNLAEAQSVYVVMELLNGVTMDQKMREKGYFTPQEANAVMQPICAALSVVHDHNIVHRDLKPENVFFHKDEERELIKLVDFGIAKYRGKVDDEEEQMKLTQAGFVVGTPFYMSPEQCGGFEVDARSDIYALGVLLYQMLTGKLPFEGNKASVIVMKHITEKAKPIYDVRPGLPAVLNGVVMHALAKKPDDRPQSVLELAHELDSAVKAVTEQDLKKVFLNATEDDLEAALLLASDPSGMGMLSDRSSATSGGLDPAAQFQKMISQEAVAISDSQQTPIDGPPGIEGLFLELFTTTKDTILLMQVIRDDLENGIKPDHISFMEMKLCIDRMRGILFGLHTTHYKN
jgi:serine/threonine protein kinase